MAMQRRGVRFSSSHLPLNSAEVDAPVATLWRRQSVAIVEADRGEGESNLRYPTFARSRERLVESAAYHARVLCQTVIQLFVMARRTTARDGDGNEDGN